MFAQLFVTMMHGLYLLLMGLLSLAGASAFVELILALVRGKPLRITRLTIETEDA